MVDAQGRHSWESLWQRLDALQDGARKLRRLSQEEPLLQARPDYPRARAGVSHAEELRGVLEDLMQCVGETRQLVPLVLRDGQIPAGVVAEEAPQAVAGRLASLARLVDSLQEQAFQPPPPLPKHAPPYLAEAPSRALAGSKAVLLSYGLEEVVAALRNALLAMVNTK